MGLVWPPFPASRSFDIFIVPHLFPNRAHQPLHRCLFPGAAAYSTFQSVTNPHEFELDGVR